MGGKCWLLLEQVEVLVGSLWSWMDNLKGSIKRLKFLLSNILNTFTLFSIDQILHFQMYIDAKLF